MTGIRTALAAEQELKDRKMTWDTYGVYQLLQRGIYGPVKTYFSGHWFVIKDGQHYEIASHSRDTQTLAIPDEPRFTAPEFLVTYGVISQAEYALNKLVARCC